VKSPPTEAGSKLSYAKVNYAIFLQKCIANGTEPCTVGSIDWS
jgi:hypothetical protein